MSIPELQKPPGVPCQHICERGCEIYDTRPASCRDWSCLWLTGDLPEPLKPDTCGVIWDNTYHNLFDQKLLAAREVRPGAHSEDANQAWLAETISRSLVLVITHDGQTHVLGPEDEVKTLETLVKRKAEQQGRRIDIEHGVRKDTKPE